MIYKVIIKESAEKDVVDAFLYYEDQQFGLGERFLLSWEKHLNFLSSHPNSFQEIYKEFRQVLIKPFPYHIIYEIEGNKIVVYKVVFAKRQPEQRYRK